MKKRITLSALAIGLLLACIFTIAGMLPLAFLRANEEMPSTEPYTLRITGGHHTAYEDGGRPVVLIAAALGVKTEVFREAFSGVTPAKNGRPSGDEARRNKEALMKVLAPYQVSNDRLDEVSNFYRYRPQDGELWKHQAARGHVELTDGVITNIVITNPGFGYSSPPDITINGMPEVQLKAELHFDTDLKRNGSVKSVVVKK